MHLILNKLSCPDFNLSLTQLGSITQLSGWWWVVAHVIIVSAQVLLALTLGLWTLGPRTRA